MEIKGVLKNSGSFIKRIFLRNNEYFAFDFPRLFNFLHSKNQKFLQASVQQLYEISWELHKKARDERVSNVAKERASNIMKEVMKQVN